MHISISEGIGWKKTLQERHNELTQLRNENSRNTTRYIGESKEINSTPTYDVKALDKMISRLAKEIRMLDEAIKRQNAKTTIESYDRNEDVLGEIV